MNIAPVLAQYSFEKVVGGPHDDRPFGIKQASDHYYYLYGLSSSFSPIQGGQNYIAKIDHLGNIVWQRTYTPKSIADKIYDMVELPDGRLFFGGIAQEQLQALNARVSIFDAQGNMQLDTLYPQVFPQCGGIQGIVHNSQQQQVITVGLGCLDNSTSALLFQTIDYNGKRVNFKVLPYPEEFRTKKIFKLKGQNKYVVFGIKKSLILDSVGNLIEGPRWAIDTSSSFADEIWDIVQLTDGTFCALLDPWDISIGSYKLQYFDSLGRFQRVGNLVLKSSLYLRSLTVTRDKGFLIAGSDFILVDSNEQIVWQKSANQPRFNETINVAQALDGGFYGTSIDWSKDDGEDPDMYIFKTNPDGIISGVSDYPNAKLIVTINPNPSKGLLTISGAFIKADVTIYNLLGQQMLPPTSIEANGKMDVSHLSDGVYIIELNSGRAIYVQKVNIIK